MGAKIGVMGLAVMGENLILNMASRGFETAAYNRTTDNAALFSNSFQPMRRRFKTVESRLNLLARNPKKPHRSNRTNRVERIVPTFQTRPRQIKLDSFFNHDFFLFEKPLAHF